MEFCTKCGNKLKEGAKFCTSCGAVVRQVSGSQLAVSSLQSAVGSSKLEVSSKQSAVGSLQHASGKLTGLLKKKGPTQKTQAVITEPIEKPLIYEYESKAKYEPGPLEEIKKPKLSKMPKGKKGKGKSATVSRAQSEVETPQPKVQQAPQVQQPAQPQTAQQTAAEQHESFMRERQKRYLERRGEIGEEAVRENLQQPYDKTIEKQSYAKPENQTKGLSLEDIMKEKDESSSLDELESLGDLSSLNELENLGGISEEKKSTKIKGVGCPSCGALNTSIIYCPYCGKAFCSDCAPKALAQSNMIFYTCAHCGKEVIVKKGQQE